MRRSVKREAQETGGSSRGREDAVAELLRTVKKETMAGGGGTDSGGRDESTQQSQHGTTDRRFLRSRYLSLINKISESRDDLTRVDSDKFAHIISEVENLHQLVQKPREQIADAEALLDITNSLVSSVKSQSANGVSPADFINGLIKGFGKPSRGIDAEEDPRVSINWKEIGLAVCSTFRVTRGCSTMIGPMDTELKRRKRAVVNRRRSRSAEGVRPEELDTQEEEKTDTDKNMATMFNILRRDKCVRLESLILNRRSFAQTVENLFALSFLVKDGRVEISADESGSHLVSPRNAPAARSVMSHEAVYNHFVFRYDFGDWKLMCEMVPEGEELMPHREFIDTPSASQPDADAAGPSQGSQREPSTTPIRKLTRNRGLVKQEETIVEDSPDNDREANKGAGIRRRCKRRLN